MPQRSSWAPQTASRNPIGDAVQQFVRCSALGGFGECNSIAGTVGSAAPYALGLVPVAGPYLVGALLARDLATAGIATAKRPDDPLAWAQLAITGVVVARPARLAARAAQGALPPDLDLRGLKFLFIGPHSGSRIYANAKWFVKRINPVDGMKHADAQMRSLYAQYCRWVVDRTQLVVDRLRDELGIIVVKTYGSQNRLLITPRIDAVPYDRLSQAEQKAVISEITKVVERARAALGMISKDVPSGGFFVDAHPQNFFFSKQAPRYIVAWIDPADPIGFRNWLTIMEKHGVMPSLNRPLPPLWLSM